MIDLLHGDCLELMKSIPDQSIDAIITDPPYGTTSCKWDRIIPFDPMWQQLNRVIKPNGAIVLFGSEPFSSALRMSNIKNYKYDWVWDKINGNGFLDCNKRPIKVHENIVIFSKYGCSNGSKNFMSYYPQGLIESNKKVKRKTTGQVLNAVKITEYTAKYKNYPKSIISYSKDKNIHPTQKPVALIEYLIKTYTNENETVLDFTMGSGTCGVACINTKRHFIGIEKDDKYFEIASKRIKTASEQLIL